jgi:hypothetical protein
LDQNGLPGTKSKSASRSHLTKFSNGILHQRLDIMLSGFWQLFSATVWMALNQRDAAAAVEINTRSGTGGLQLAIRFSITHV